tara:strand:+ start:686 stop:1138 length:453 start_codon:yes stop_codon:yes gene_type:complete
MKKEIKEGDVHIRRTSNGWVLSVYSETDQAGETWERQFVFEDPEDLVVNSYCNHRGQAESLHSLLWTAFDDQFQSKRAGGLVVSVAETGYEPHEAREPEVDQDEEPTEPMKPIPDEDLQRWSDDGGIGTTERTPAWSGGTEFLYTIPSDR